MMAVLLFHLCAIGTPEHGPDASHEFIGIEGLGEIIVGSGIQAEDTVLLLDAGRQENYREIFAPTQLLENGKAVEDGEHDVEDDEIVGAV